MRPLSRLPSALAFGFALFGSRATNAACVISGVKPTVALPTMAAGQEFSFVATADCETLRFVAQGAALSKIPKAGPDRGSKDRTYKVVLTEREWNSVVDARDQTFTWSIVGTTSTGVTTRVTTTNALNVDGRVTVNLSMADAELVGENEYDYAGISVSGAGDMDGDGHDDWLVGAVGNGEGAYEAGAAYLVLGPVTGTFDLSRADAKLLGEEAFDWAGSSVSSARDVDGDGNDDLLVGALGNDEGGTDAGASYLVLGPVTGTLDLSLADAKLVGEASGDYVGGSVFGAGDTDGDGRDDLLVGATFNAPGGADPRDAYLVLGPVCGTLDLSVADAKLIGEAAEWVGPIVSGAGDVDGDGRDDLLVGAVLDDPVRRQLVGAVYLVLGPVTGSFDLSLADAKLISPRRFDYGGVSVSGAGDVDGDGHDDVLVGAYPTDETHAAVAYVVLGPVSGTLDLSAADATLFGEETSDFAGYSVSGAGDVDADGNADVLVGAFRNDGAGFDSGAAYVVLGPVTGTLDLSLADAKLVGEADGNYVANSVSGAGDVDGDAHDDLLVGAAYTSPGGTLSGAVYLVDGASLF